MKTLLIYEKNGKKSFLYQNSTKKKELHEKNKNLLYFINIHSKSVKDTFFESLKSNIRTGETGNAK